MSLCTEGIEHQEGFDTEIGEDEKKILLSPPSVPVSSSKKRKISSPQDALAACLKKKATSSEATNAPLTKANEVTLITTLSAKLDVLDEKLAELETS